MRRTPIYKTISSAGEASHGAALRAEAATHLGLKPQAAEYYDQAGRVAPGAPLPRALAARARLALDDVDAAERDARAPEKDALELKLAA